MPCAMRCWAQPRWVTSGCISRILRRSSGTIDSKLLLARCARMVRDAGYEIGNADCTVMMQRPRLRPHIDRMRETLAQVMGIPTDAVSVKATTTEHLGFEGREEGVSASAAVLLFRP